MPENLPAVIRKDIDSTPVQYTQPSTGYLNISELMIQSFVFESKSKNLTDHTIRTYTQGVSYLLRFARSIRKELTELTRDDLKYYIVTQLQHRSPAGVNNYLRTFKIFYNHCIREGYVEKSPIGDIPLCREPKKVKRVISPEEFVEILSCIKPYSFPSHRCYCMLLLIWDCMLRVGEALSLKLPDLHLNPDRLVTVYGKGRKERTLPFSATTAKKLIYYLSEFRRFIPGELVFPTRSGRQHLPRNIYREFKQAGLKAGIPNVHPHRLRHSAATHYYNLTGDCYMVSKILGHADVKTTERYLHGSTKNLIEAYRKVSPVSTLKIK
jgi:site-specific recombinase XerD